MGRPAQTTTLEFEAAPSRTGWVWRVAPGDVPGLQSRGCSGALYVGGAFRFVTAVHEALRLTLVAEA